MIAADFTHRFYRVLRILPAKNLLNIFQVCFFLGIFVRFKQKRPGTTEVGKIAILSEFWEFLRVRKKLWLAPIVFVLLLLGLLIVATSNTALAPFIYALF